MKDNSMRITDKSISLYSLFFFFLSILTREMLIQVREENL